MNFRDQLSGLFWLAISCFVCVVSARAGIGGFHNPGAGFLPFWSAVALGVFSITLVASTVIRKSVETRKVNLWKGLAWHRVIIVSVSLFIYAILLPALGYVVAAFGLLTILFSIEGIPKWWIPVVSALITVLVTYVSFDLWLGVLLPKGILGF